MRLKDGSQLGMDLFAISVQRRLSLCPKLFRRGFELSDSLYEDLGQRLSFMLAHRDQASGPRTDERLQLGPDLLWCEIRVTAFDHFRHRCDIDGPDRVLKRKLLLNGDERPMISLGKREIRPNALLGGGNRMGFLQFDLDGAARKARLQSSADLHFRRGELPRQADLQI